MELAKIGVWQTAFLGDALLSLPMLAALNAAWPGAEVHFFVRRGLEDLFSAQEGLAGVHGFDKRGGQKGPAAALALGRDLSGRGFDLWISAHASLRSALVAWSSKIPRRIGYDRPWFNRLAYTQTVDRAFARLEEIERLFQLLAPLGIALPAPKARLTLPGRAVEKAARFWDERLGRDKVLGLHPGSTWPTKCWPAERFARIAALAARAGVRALVFGGPGEEDLAGRIAAQAQAEAGAEARERVLNLAGGLDLPELAAFIGRLDACLTNDSGPMHLAWIQDVPLTALFGPTVRSLGFFPRGPGSTVLETDLDCRPCGLHGPRRCPLGHQACMTGIEVDAVWAALEQKLGL
ncbi:MAG: glycosyltransferase family 9 protein [Desulfovibrionaceae bacterium]|nr:glycosyltransferase family 9 protein [Desulfovibrionaceae bacterium]